MNKSSSAAPHDRGDYGKVESMNRGGRNGFLGVWIRGGFLVLVVVLLAGCNPKQRALEAEERADAARPVDHDTAVAGYSEALRLAPGNPALYVKRGLSQSKLGNREAALADLDLALEKMEELRSKGRITDGKMKEFLVALHGSRSEVYVEAGDHEEAIAELERATLLNPDDIKIKNNLAWVLATSPESGLRNGQRAVALATTACEKSGWNKVRYIDTLAAAHAAAGDFERAVEVQQMAISNVSNPNSKADLQTRVGLYNFQTRLELYKNRKAFFEEVREY